MCARTKKFLFGSRTFWQTSIRFTNHQLFIHLLTYMGFYYFLAFESYRIDNHSSIILHG